MMCPNCNVVLTIAERSGVEIDFCPQCRGVWLDRGELDKIIDRVTAEMKPAASPTAAIPDPSRERFRDDRFRSEPIRIERYDDDDDDYRKKRKKKNFLDDLFDF